MKKTITALTNRLQKLNFVSHFLNSFPEPDFNVKGCFTDKEFIEQIEIGPRIFSAADLEPEIRDLRLLFPV